jgi:meso-butanediol dehydrogenase / (S,S)-butanediol dehydrogenase / diacetyl reductase
VLNLEHGCPEPAPMGQNVGPNVTATALVTGGAHGIGWACASRLAEEGARVAVTDLDQDAARQVAKGLTDEARRHLAVRLDVTDVSSVEQAFADAASGLGGIDSINALTALGNEPYSSAKAGIGSLTINLAASLAPDGIRVNAVAPATIRTRSWDRQDGGADRLRHLYPLGRVGEPEDVAAAVAFLASSDAAWITGHTLPVDGGLLTGPRTR